MNASRPLDSGSGIRFRGPLAIMTLATALAMPLRATAAPTPAEAAGDEADTGPEAGTARARAPDTRTGHLLIDAKVGVTAPAGMFTSGVVPSSNRPTAGTTVSDITGTGMSVGGSIGMGISRHVVVAATGTYSYFFRSDPLKGIGQDGRGFDLGLGLRYHLAQGVAIDPWASFGLGVRLTDFTTLVHTSNPISLPACTTPDKDTETSVHCRYRGLDFAKIGLGADFYPLPSLGVGAYIEADLGTNFVQQDPPHDGGASHLASGSDQGRAVYAFIHLGLRIAFDPFRSGSPKVRSATARR